MMSRFQVIPSVKFEVLIPTRYVRRDDPTQTPQFVQLTEVARYLANMTAKYGYTMSNPHAPPPFVGGYQGSPPERSFWVTLIVPEDLLDQAEQDILEMVTFFQERYYQEEILAYHYSINRYIPFK